MCTLAFCPCCSLYVALLICSTNSFFLFCFLTTKHHLFISLTPCLTSLNAWLYSYLPSFTLPPFLLNFIFMHRFAKSFLVSHKFSHCPKSYLLQNTPNLPSHLVHHHCSHACVSSLSFLPPHGRHIIQDPAGPSAPSLSQPGQEPEQRESFAGLRHHSSEDHRNYAGMEGIIPGTNVFQTVTDSQLESGLNFDRPVITHGKVLI